MYEYKNVGSLSYSKLSGIVIDKALEKDPNTR